MKDLKPIGAPGSAARWDQERGELFNLIGAHMLAAGIEADEAQTVCVTDAVMKHVYGPYPQIGDEVFVVQGLSSKNYPNN